VLYDHLEPFLVELFNQFLRMGTMHESFKKGYICLIFKKGDPTLIKNYRPISLLRADYKLFTKILSKRLSDALADVICVEQRAFRC